MDTLPTHHEWQLHEAKNKLSQVVDLAMHNEPQIITLGGKKAAVIVSIEAYMKLIRSASTLSEFFRQSPLMELNIDLTRN